jgi:Cd2+/Zn2+-exporting ATPase
MTRTVRFRIEGMDCAEEIALLRKEVGGREGVVSLDFNLLDGRMDVTYRPEAVSPEEIAEAVAAAGLRAVPWARRAARAPEGWWRAHGRLVMAAAAGLLTLAGFLLHWRLHGDLLHALHVTAPTPGQVLPPPVMLLYLAAIVSGAWYVLPRAFISARHLRPDMNLLMTLAVLGAALIHEWLEAAMVAFLFAAALLLEQWSVGRARRAIAALMELTPPTTRRRDPKTGAVQECNVADVGPGERLLVRPGERVPLDGLVVDGASSVNQAPITGESMPVAKTPGDELYAGTINEEGVLEFEVTRAADDTMLARIVRMVSEAHGRRAPAEQWVEKFARWYTPAMMALALCVFIGPPLLAGKPWLDWFYRALVVLVIACPCALVISTPVSIVSGLASAARNGVLIKGGLHLETAGRLRAVALDKTGTLTHGRPEVREVVPLAGHTRREVLERAAALEAHSEHPLARALLREARAEGIDPQAVAGFRIIKGEGAEGMIGGRLHWIGSHRMMDSRGQETPESHDRAEELEDAGHSVITLGNDAHVCGVISVADQLRDGAAENVAAIRRAGVARVVMLTGDNEGTASAVAKAAGVDEYRSELLPEDKLRVISELVREAGPTAMVGDGVNDAPAMAAASLGIAMGAIGTDAAIETADVALMSDDLSRIPWLIRHSRRTLAVVKQNICFALGVKAAFMLLALLGLATLWMAVAADMGASLLVIFNGLRLLKTKD